MLRREESEAIPSDHCKLVIDEELTIYVIDSIREELSKELDIYNNFDLNLAAVEEFDSAGVQLLLAFTHEIKRLEKTFTLSKASPVVMKLFDTYGLSDYFNIANAA